MAINYNSICVSVIVLLQLNEQLLLCVLLPTEVVQALDKEFPWATEWQMACKVLNIKYIN